MWSGVGWNEHPDDLYSLLLLNFAASVATTKPARSLIWREDVKISSEAVREGAYEDGHAEARRDVQATGN